MFPCCNQGKYLCMRTMMNFPYVSIKSTKTLFQVSFLGGLTTALHLVNNLTSDTLPLDIGYPGHLCLAAHQSQSYAHPLFAVISCSLPGCFPTMPLIMTQPNIFNHCFAQPRQLFLHLISQFMDSQTICLLLIIF